MSTALSKCSWLCQCAQPPDEIRSLEFIFCFAFTAQYMYMHDVHVHRAIIESDDESEKSSVSIVVSIPACHVGDLGSIPRRSD